MTHRTFVKLSVNLIVLIKSTVHSRKWYISLIQKRLFIKFPTSNVRQVTTNVRLNGLDPMESTVFLDISIDAVKTGSPYRKTIR